MKETCRTVELSYADRPYARTPIRFSPRPYVSAHVDTFPLLLSSLRDRAIYLTALEMRANGDQRTILH